MTSQASTVFLATHFPWWILLLLLFLILFLVLCAFLAWWCRNKVVGKGYYDMDAESDFGKNKSDIYYTTEDAERIINEMSNTVTDGQQAGWKTPETV